LHIPDVGLVDEQQKVRTITALTIAALAEAATPYGIESFDYTRQQTHFFLAHEGKYQILIELLMLNSNM